MNQEEAAFVNSMDSSYKAVWKRFRQFVIDHCGGPTLREDGKSIYITRANVDAYFRDSIHTLTIQPDGISRHRSALHNIATNWEYVDADPPFEVGSKIVDKQISK